MFSISYLRSVLFFGATGSNDDILKGFTFASSVNEMIFIDTYVTVKVPFNFTVRSLYMLTISPESISI